MKRRQPLPRIWLMTDERQGEGLWSALERLPKGGGIVFRHYGTPPTERRRLFGMVRKAARSRRQLLLLAGPPAQAAAWGADGCHGPWRKRSGLWLSRAAHDPAELKAAEKAGADLVFLSPAFATRSHPGARPLGPLRFKLLARQTRLPVIALGGMNRQRARRLAGNYGWAGIDCWAEDQKRKAVPI